MKLQVLGCSGGVGPGLRTTGLLLDDEILIDAGTGVGDLSLRRMERIRSVFLTHSHLDHVCGLAFLADNLFGLVEHPMLVFATKETVQAVRSHIFNWEIWPDFSQLPEPEHAMMSFREIAIGEDVMLGGERHIQAFEVLHTVPAVGYAVHGPEGVFAFSGDTLDCEPLWRALNRLPRLDQLMIEIAFPDDQLDLAKTARHFTPRLLGMALQSLVHKPRILLTHHKPGFETVIKKQCKVALKGWDYVHLKRGDIIEL